MSTYLQLVNSAILNSGADLDEIDVSDFADPSKSLARKFKTWTNQAWREIQQELNDWEYMSKTAQLIIYPQLLVVDGDRASDPPVGSTFQGDDTGATFEVTGVTILDGGFATGDATAVLTYESLEDGPFKWNELFDEVTPTPANTDVFRLKSYARYNLQSMVSDMLEMDISSVFLQSTGGSATQTNTADSDNRQIAYLPWAQFVIACEGDAQTRGRPYCFTVAPDGLYDFFPKPCEQLVLTFTYSAEPQELSASNDTPEGLPANYHDAIVWRTIMYWADFSESQSQFQRASRRYLTYKNRMDRNQRRAWSFSPNQFSVNYDRYAR